MNNGWIKLHRKLLDWEWYDDTNVMRIFTHILLTANHKQKKWRGNVVNPGETITSYSHLANETGLTVQNVRTALNKLKSTHEVTIKTNTKFTLIKLNNWDKYQDTNTPPNKQLTNNQQATNNKQECKNDKNDKKESRFTPPSILEVQEYITENEYTVDAESWIDFYTSKGWKIGANKMKDWKAAVRTWEKRNKDTQSNITIKL